MIALAAAAPSESDSLLSTSLKFVKDCGDKSMVLCFKVRYSVNNSTTNKKVQFKLKTISDN